MRVGSIQASHGSGSLKLMFFCAARASKVHPGVTKWAEGHSQAALCQMALRSGWLAARGRCRKQSTYGSVAVGACNKGAQTRPREWSAARKHSHMHRESHMHGEKPPNIWNQSSMTTPPPHRPIAFLSALLPLATWAASPITPTDTYFITPVTDYLF